MDNELHSDDISEDMTDDLDEIKILTLTRNETLYLSDSMTLLLEHTNEPGKMYVPARQLIPQAGVPVPLELIQKVGLAVLLATDPKNTTQTAQIEVSVADLFLLRECCQTFIKINTEQVGYNLIRKIYALILEHDIMERSFIEDLTTGIDMTISLTAEEKLRKGRDND